jgi:photosystem II stability/assembly factor-like uncharacterized protein
MVEKKLKSKHSSDKKSIKNLNKTKIEEDKGPAEWLIPVLESSYSKLVPREHIIGKEISAETVTRRPGSKKRQKGKLPIEKESSLLSRLQPEHKREEVLSDISYDYWYHILKEYKQRKARSAEERGVKSKGRISTERPVAAMPAVPGINNWVPIGPEVVSRGQAVGRPSIGGRVSRMVIASGGQRIYAATANGGVFRSDNGGNSWQSTMDGFDTDPNNFASTSLACGAIAIVPANPDRVYVGTGEGDTDILFRRRLTNALPSYRGIGAISSSDGGSTWIVESSSPSLAGFAFYEIAVDPTNPENAVAATTNGLYQRTISASGVLWQQRRSGVHSSVVVASTGSTGRTFFSAPWGGPVYTSSDGITWSLVGSNFPSSNVGRIALGVQPDNPNVLYALVANSGNGILGVYRLDGASGSWRSIAGVPNILLGGQGDYDLCIAVDPNNSNLIYLGGDRINSSPYPANIQRCVVSASGLNYSMTATPIGSAAHADVHTLVFAPGDSNTLWTGTDGGCFVNRDPAGSGSFEGRNTGLSSLCTDFIGMSVSDPAIIYCGLQDNGTARYLGEELWRHVQGGDGGYCVVHPTNPFRALVYANGTVYQTSTGGQDYANWSTSISPPWSLMYEPLVGAPGSERVAFGAGTSIFISNDFGNSWPSTISLPAGSNGIYSMVFANDLRLFVGTTNGQVYRADLVGSSWSLTRIDNVAAGPLGMVGLVSDIAIDWSDSNRQSIYICFGGNGDFRHVWRFDGTSWQARSGAGATRLIDVEHNAIVVDPSNSSHVYVGADIGVWASVDGGNNWTTLEGGLPDAPVFDLQIHNGARILRASTHGRGVYEYRLDPPPLSGIELYVRDTILDTARGENTDGRNDPSKWPTTPVAHWISPNIKVDVPTPAGYQTPTNQIDFVQFHEIIVDGSNGVGTIDPPLVVHNRVYVLVHNRGPMTASSVRVLTAITNASTVLNPLPSGYAANIQAGTALAGPDWITLGTVNLSNLRPGFPQVAAFDLPSNILPMPASLPGQSHFCLLTFLHSSADAFTAAEQNVDILTIQERKVAQKNLHIVQFIGTPPPAGKGIGNWARLDITGFLFEEGGMIDLVFDLRIFPGKLHLLVPEELLPDSEFETQKDFAVLPNTLAKKWYKKYSVDAKRLYREGKFRKDDYEYLESAMKSVSERPVLEPRSKVGLPILTKLKLKSKSRYTIFFRIDPPRGAEIGQSWNFSIIQRDSITGKIHGGAEYSVRINRPAKK